MKSRRVSLFIATLASAALASCIKFGHFEKDRAAAISATETLHRLYNEEKYDLLYQISSRALQQSITLAHFKASISSTKLQAGKQISSKLVASSCLPNEVRLVYHSQFETGHFTESIMWSVPADTALLVMYQISPGHVPADKQAQKGCPV
jgi:hypothetical protein